MIIFPLVLAVSILVVLGYLAVWTSMHENTEKGLAGFGKVMGTILFVLAGLTMIFGLWHGMRMHSQMGMMGMSAPLGYCGAMGTMGCMGTGASQSCCGMMNKMGDMHGARAGKGMKPPEMKGDKEELIEEMREMKMRDPKMWQESLDEVNKGAPVKK